MQMPKYWKTLVAVVVMAGGNSVAIADGYQYEPVGKSFVAPEIWSWTGFYVGAHGGYAWQGVNGVYDDDDAADVVSLSRLNLDRGFGGVQVGYNYQIQQFVIGL